MRQFLMCEKGATILLLIRLADDRNMGSVLSKGLSLLAGVAVILLTLRMSFRSNMSITDTRDPVEDFSETFCQTFCAILTEITAYIDGNFPATWPMSALEEVHMPMEDTVHFALDTPAGTAERTSLLPPGHGILRLGASQEVFSIAMFHQLRCLDIIGVALVDLFSQVELPSLQEEKQPALVQHCMDYVRQMVLCHADLTILNFKSVEKRPHIKNSDITHVCKDYSAVFAAAEANYVMYN